jgi:Spy/CpxP family protein refolding chaperone
MVTNSEVHFQGETLMNRYAALIASLVLLVAGAVFVAGAQEGRRPGGPGGPGGRNGFDRMAQDLNLTADQKTQIEQIRTAERTASEPLMKQLGEKRRALETATANGQFDETAVRAIAQDQSKFEVELTVIRERTKSQIYNILTPEQREKLAQHRPGFGGPGRRQGPPPDGGADNN